MQPQPERLQKTADFRAGRVQGLLLVGQQQLHVLDGIGRDHQAHEHGTIAFVTELNSAGENGFQPFFNTWRQPTVEGQRPGWVWLLAGLLVGLFAAYVAGIGAEVVVFGLGMLAVFIARERPIAVGSGFLVAALTIVLVAQVHINGPTLEIVSDIFVVLAVLGTLMYLVIRVMESLSQSRTRYSDLANVIPVATFELDVSGVLKRLSDLTGPELAALSSAEAQHELYEELMGAVMINASPASASVAVM